MQLESDLVETQNEVSYERVKPVTSQYVFKEQYCSHGDFQQSGLCLSLPML